VCRECGVLVPVGGQLGQGDAASSAAVGCNGGGGGDGGLEMFSGLVPVPMEWPGKSFTGDATGGATRMPWFYQDG